MEFDFRLLSQMHNVLVHLIHSSFNFHRSTFKLNCSIQNAKLQIALTSTLRKRIEMFLFGKSVEVALKSLLLRISL